ncbi:DUF6918 family protein [Saccharopolyspora spinosa]|uniref:DUF6918 family protein n=1 Tax=Saccharopolyspora spinosa TaxID=60894 RepID=UPI001ED8D0FE|nr:hypothetical protein [Saccharopolyspora spinosa]
MTPQGNLLDSSRRPAVVADQEKVVDEEVADKDSVSGAVIKTGFTAVMGVTDPRAVAKSSRKSIKKVHEKPRLNGKRTSRMRRPGSGHLGWRLRVHPLHPTR